MTESRHRRQRRPRRHRPDNAVDAWQAVAAGAATAHGYGSYALSASGVWTYTLDNDNAAVQALNGADTLTDSFTALTAAAPRSS